MADSTSRPYRPGSKCCTRCVFGEGLHAAWCDVGYLPNVIDQLLSVIPKTEGSFRCILGDIHGSAAFASPEAQKMWWWEAADALSAELGPPCALSLPWQKEVLRIFKSGGTVQ